VECYHSGVGVFLRFCRECGVSPDSRFFVSKIRKELRKNEKNRKNDEPGYDPGYAADPDRLRRQHRSSR
jgi:hypothetical protein